MKPSVQELKLRVRRSSDVAENITPDQASHIEHLEKAERHVRNCAAIVSRQRTLVARLSEGGELNGIAQARQWLSRFKDMQEAFVKHRAMILRELEM